MTKRQLAKVSLALLGCGAILATARPAAAGLLAQERPAMIVWYQPADPLAPPPPGVKQLDRLLIGVFARTTSGRLVARRWGGTAWLWVDHGLPPATSLACAPAAVAWRVGTLQMINVFACGADGTLVERRFNGYGWSWIRHEAPTGIDIDSPPAAIFRKDAAGANRLSVFFVGSDGLLHERFSSGGTTWGWRNHGRSISHFQGGEAPAVVGWETAGRLSVFLRDDVGDLTERRLAEGGAWEWKDHPDPLVSGLVAPLTSAAIAVAWRPPGVIVRLQVFAIGGTGGHLRELWGDDKDLAWEDHGLPPTATPWYPYAAAAWANGSMSMRMNLFGRGSGGNLIERWFDGATWRWNDHGTPPSTSLGEAAPAIVTWKAGTVTRFNLFAVGLDGSLVEYWWSGNQWSWTEHKFPPFP